MSTAVEYKSKIIKKKIVFSFNFLSPNKISWEFPDFSRCKKNSLRIYSNFSREYLNSCLREK